MTAILLCPHLSERESSGLSSYKDTNPIMGTPFSGTHLNLITYQRHHIGGWGFNIWIWGADTNIQSTTRSQRSKQEKTPNTREQVEKGRKNDEIKMGCPGLHWWCSGEESACQCTGHRFDPWSGKIPHAMEQLSPRATATEARVPGARAPQQEKPPQWEAHCSEKPVHRNDKQPPLTATRESLSAATKTQRSHK